MQAAGDAHDTPLRMLYPDPGLGLCTTDQVRVVAPAGTWAASNAKALMQSTGTARSHRRVIATSPRRAPKPVSSSVPRQRGRQEVQLGPQVQGPATLVAVELVHRDL